MKFGVWLCVVLSGGMLGSRFEFAGIELQAVFLKSGMPELHISATIQDAPSLGLILLPSRGTRGI